MYNRPQIVILSFVLMICSSLSSASADTEVLRTAETDAALQYEFTDDDNQLLDEIQRGCFEFLWKEVGDPIPIVKDRLTNSDVSSLAGVGFQLSALPIGVERGWITREQGEQRAHTILKALVERDDNKKHGIYLHFVDLNTGGMHFVQGPQVFVSTVDHALLQAGAIVASEYFGGECQEYADRMISEANWKAFEVQLNKQDRKFTNGRGGKFISFGWRPQDDQHDVNVPGEFRPWCWWKASAEEQLLTFLAVGSPTPEHAVAPDMYYRLHRRVMRHKDLPPFVVSWGGPAFTHFFCPLLDRLC